MNESSGKRVSESSGEGECERGEWREESVRESSRERVSESSGERERE